jgi:hypothetical protein
MQRIAGTLFFKFKKLSGVFDTPVYTSKNIADIGTSMSSPFV